ncbi:hypothetical protein SDRG_09478 [Saprolegnia diclina VS20]|uniref:CHCH domain-containing protein n=1 Tax=Saprolegnia diclina (strain VS20) TaxID=1156394 RepID=T0Q564_SAPDV|nr:hypothetical protein SDRG_09478 [Saprolegnia diclina VS20]EQC32949.1 hypothetical protein SDRG_09478 [Saprolegnia diclina VS20]|eukprot:XP_008613635.1 hypothetical protein SDRG_09478 [Saprolegnia diclina VS20]
MPAKPECLTCKPGNPTHHASAVAATGCQAIYEKVDACMKQHKGRVSACVEEWEAFRACHKKDGASPKTTM